MMTVSPLRLDVFGESVVLSLLIELLLSSKYDFTFPRKRVGEVALLIRLISW
jgi:hypothetical protein